MPATKRILLIGQWQWPWYHEACAKALESLGCSVIPFAWSPSLCREIDGKHHSIWTRIQDRLVYGPILSQINKSLLLKARETKPDVVWIYNGTHIWPETIKEMRQDLPKAVFVQYTNDNPFGKQLVPDRQRYVKRAIPLFDIHFIYSPSNEKEFKDAGAPRTALLRSYYQPEVDRRIELGPGDERFECDVVFAGHYEKDGRLECLEALAGKHRLNLFGGGWHRARISQHSALRSRMPIPVLLGSEYRQALSGAKIALCFLSTLNKDTYTRRNFEIPAMETFMLSQYTEDLAGLYREGVEAEFFRSKEELVDKTDFYLKNESARSRIARAGYERLKRDGHDVTSRMKDFLIQLGKI